MDPDKLHIESVSTDPTSGGAANRIKPFIQKQDQWFSWGNVEKIREKDSCAQKIQGALDEGKDADDRSLQEVFEHWRELSKELYEKVIELKFAFCSILLEVGVDCKCLHGVLVDKRTSQDSHQQIAYRTLRVQLGKSCGYLLSLSGPGQEQAGWW